MLSLKISFTHPTIPLNSSYTHPTGGDPTYRRPQMVDNWTQLKNMLEKEYILSVVALHNISSDSSTSNTHKNISIAPGNNR